MLKHGSGNGGNAALQSTDLMSANPGSFDIVSYYHYDRVSVRCGSMKLGTMDAPPSPSSDLRLFAHCLPGKTGGVGLVALNLGNVSQIIPVGRSSQLWEIKSQKLESREVKINGRSPMMNDDGKISGLEGVRVKGFATLPAKTIAFAAVAGANNNACR